MFLASVEFLVGESIIFSWCDPHIFVACGQIPIFPGKKSPFFPGKRPIFPGFWPTFSPRPVAEAMLAWSFAHLGGSVGVMAALAESARQRVEERQLGQVMG